MARNVVNSKEGSGETDRSSSEQQRLFIDDTGPVPRLRIWSIAADGWMARNVVRWGYPDKRGREDRQNFGGIYRVGNRHDATKLTLTLYGYDPEEPDRFDPNGCLVLVSDDDVIAAGWTFRKLVECWSQKHAAAAYVPAMCMDDPRRFHYGSKVLVCEGTDFLVVLSALAAGHMYLDPAIKAEGYSTPSPVTKRRNQFRIQRSEIPRLYKRSLTVEL
jgi:hypothetical protein